MFHYMVPESLEHCCTNHIEARLKSYEIRFTMSYFTTSELTSNERDCLYACNGMNDKCKNYKEVDTNFKKRCAQ